MSYVRRFAWWIIPLALVLVLLLPGGCGSNTVAPPPDNSSHDDGEPKDDNPPGNDNANENDNGGDDDTPPDDDGDGDDDGIDVAPPPVEGDVCYAGMFECANGPEVVPCGTWQFTVNETNAIVGQGTFSEVMGPAPVEVAFSGLFDPEGISILIDLAGPGAGTGTLRFSFRDASSNVSGEWSYQGGDEPDAGSAAGTATGSPCVGIE